MMKTKWSLNHKTLIMLNRKFTLVKGFLLISIYLESTKVTHNQSDPQIFNINCYNQTLSKKKNVLTLIWKSSTQNWYRNCWLVDHRAVFDREMFQITDLLPVVPLKRFNKKPKLYKLIFSGYFLIKSFKKSTRSNRD